MQNDFYHTNLREARERAGLTQGQLAEAIGVDRTVILALETGRTRLFSKQLPKLAAYYGRSIGELLFSVDPEQYLRGEQLRTEREDALAQEYERRLAERDEKIGSLEQVILQLEQALADSRKTVASLQQNNEYLLEQLRKGE